LIEKNNEAAVEIAGSFYDAVNVDIIIIRSIISKQYQRN